MRVHYGNPTRTNFYYILNGCVHLNRSLYLCINYLVSVTDGEPEVISNTYSRVDMG